MAIIYDRLKKEIVNENDNGLLKFLYKNSFGRVILKIINKAYFSIFVGFICNCRISRIYIKKFIKDNSINMDDYENNSYNCFNAFFIRKIKQNKRPLGKDLISIADSKLTYYKISENLLFSVKNSIYNVSELIRDKELAKEYVNGDLLIFRLGPDDYHRYIFFDDGVYLLRKKIKGLFHTVNPISFDNYKVFKENSREVCVLGTKKYGKVIEVDVGALNVGKITNYDIENFSRGEEKGFFSFGGSTIILIFKENQIKIDKDILDKSLNNIETKVLQGESIGKKIK